MVRKIEKHKATDFLQQADEFLASAQENLNKKRYDAAGFDAIQAMININDALTIHLLGQRASADHREAVRLHVDVVRIIHDNRFVERFKQALDRRSEAGYLGKKMKSDKPQNCWNWHFASMGGLKIRSKNRSQILKIQQ